MTLTAEVSGSTAVSKVEFYRDNSIVNTDTASPYSYQDTPPGVGTYSYFTRAVFTDQSQSDSTAISVRVVAAAVAVDQDGVTWELNSNGFLNRVTTLSKPSLPLSGGLGSVTIDGIELFVENQTTSYLLDLLPLSYISAHLPNYALERYLIASVRFVPQEGYTYRVQYKEDNSLINWSPELTIDDAIRGYILWCNYKASWLSWNAVPATFRLVQFGEASTVIGASYSEDVNGDGVDETVQNVTVSRQSRAKDYIRITLSLPNSVSGHHYQIQICIGGGQWTDFDDFDPIIGDGETLSIITDILETTLQLAKFRFVDFGEVTDSQLVVDFKNHKMTDWKKVRPSTPPGTRIGVIKGDTIEFRLREKSGLDLATTEATWSGEKAGTGDTISVTFNHLGNRRQSVQYNNGTAINTTITVKEATGLGKAL